MLQQRDHLERMTQMSHNERWVTEISDKCGDECIHQPGKAAGRFLSDNAGLWRYRVSLQANVFAGKLYHLTLLLPNLRTGVSTAEFDPKPTSYSLPPLLHYPTIQFHIMAGELRSHVSIDGLGPSD